MGNKSLKLPVIILVIGLVLSLIACMLTGVLREPTITEQDFEFTVTYQLDGETKTLDGVYRVQFKSTGLGTDPLDRYYEGTFLTNSDSYHPAAYTITEKDGLELCIATVFSNSYLMGDGDGRSFNYDPCLVVMDQEGMEYSDEEMLGKFDAEILDWAYPAPVDNVFKFAGFSVLHDISMLAMLAIGLLVIVTCIIFVKRDKTVPYKALDKISVVLNYVSLFALLPFITVGTLMMQITVSGDELMYQALLCIPALTAFSVAASIALRRKSYTKAGFFIQFVGPVLFALILILETILPV